MCLLSKSTAGVLMQSNRKIITAYRAGQGAQLCMQWTASMLYNVLHLSLKQHSHQAAAVTCMEHNLKRTSFDILVC
jgi:hypothetical protein